MIPHLELVGSPSQSLTLHGFDIVRSDPSELPVYLVNHRPKSIPTSWYTCGDGGLYFTNDARSKGDIIREVAAFLRLSEMTVGYCHINHGCKIAARCLKGANGIQKDGSLVLADVVKTDILMDNISAGEDGMLYIAETAGDPTKIYPATVFRLSRSTERAQGHTVSVLEEPKVTGWSTGSLVPFLNWNVRKGLDWEFLGACNSKSSAAA
ncbi:hypothetical protein K439DRAFT_1610164 [Ramaria rubella]|nr:hypothetical protein K439DRAFT_1610164 [Ramaria rubella]